MHSSPRRRRPPHRGVSALIATILLVLMSVVGAALLWAFRFNLPPSGVTITYVAEGNQVEPAWSDPTDCSNTTIYANCDVLPAVFIVFTGHSPTNIALADLKLTFVCNGTSLVNGTFNKLEVIPGTGASPGPGAPKLGACGTWAPSPKGFTATYFNRLLYFQQLHPGSTILLDGDLFVIYVHPATNFCDRTGHCSGPGGSDDDYHGAPPWCFTVPGACSIYLTYTGNPPFLIATISMTQLAE